MKTYTEIPADAFAGWGTRTSAEVLAGPLQGGGFRVPADRPAPLPAGTEALFAPGDEPRVPLQWHFALLGDLPAVWQEISGAGVRVGLYDDGMDQAHEDLAANYDPSLHYDGIGRDDGRPNTPADGHGTAVGGLVGAALNGVGGLGVAWGASLTMVDYLGDLQYADEAIAADALDWSAQFDVVNQSYGIVPAFADLSDIGDPGSRDWTDAQSFDFAARTGRDGLGTVFVKAAGNSANDPELESYGILGNAQGEGLNNLHMLITTGAVDVYGWVAPYASYGANLLVSAPAASHTTDVTGPGGYDPGDYTDTFGGTSAATALTTGVVALMLEAEPGLGFRDVQNILAASAAQTGSDYGGPAKGHEVGPWQGLGGASWNGGAMSYSLSYGYGRVDAFAAVRMAEVWLEMQGAAMTDANMASDTVSRSVAQPIRDLQTTLLPLTVEAGIVVEHVYVTVDLVHDYAADLTIELVAPDGTAVPLYMGDGGSAPFDDDWTFGVAALRGMPSGGTWALRVTDGARSDEGVLRGATLEILGSPDSADDIWSFTDDFPALAAVEPARRMATDGDGGSDWISTVAVARDVRVALGETASLAVAGVPWATVSGGIEHAATGDGDDVVIGSAAANTVLSGRGRDLVRGGAGADGLTGGPGGDVLLGDGPGIYHTEESARVYRLFDTVFDREPAVAGHQGWAAQLTLGKVTPEQVAEAFLAAPAFRATHGLTSDAEFITLLFRNALDREPAPAGLANWVAQLAGGMSRAEVVLAISESAEHELRTDAAQAAFDTTHDITSWADDVYRLYRLILDREPGAGGFEAWTAALAAGTLTLAEAIESFLGTPEFLSASGPLGDAAFITLLFENGLDRAPAPSGLAAWAALLAGGLGRGEVVERFLAAPEFLDRTAADMAGFMTGLGPGDLLRADGGDDLLSGGLYADRFVFVSDGVPGTVTVTDVEPWDMLVFEGFGPDAGQIFAAMTQQGDDVVLSLGGELLLMPDTRLDMLDAGMIEIL